jgi:hypothetical protein
MKVATQISGNIRPGNMALHALKTMLTHIGIIVTHPTADESLFYETDANAAWQQYDNELAFYRSIASSSFHFIYNDGSIDEEIGTQIMYAMLKNRPILMTGVPVFASDISLFIRDTIKKHLHDFHPVKLPDLELTELSLLLHKLKPTDYSLSRSEKVLIQARVRSLFRNLLEDAKELRLAKVQSMIRPIEEN